MPLNKSDKQYDLFRPNKTRPIVSRDIQSSIATFEVVGVATGGAGLFVKVDGVTSTYATIGAQNAADAATGAAGVIQADLDAAYAIGEYTAVAVGSTITLKRSNNDPLWVEETFTTDPSQLIQQTGGDHKDTALLDEVEIAGSGKPLRYDAGFKINNPDLPAGDRSITLVINAELVNGSGGPVTARWRVWWWFDSLGWCEDQEVGIRSITEPSGSSLLKDIIAISAIGAEKCAVEFIDDGAGGPMPAGASFSAWGVIAH